MLATTSRRCFVCSARWLGCSRQILRCTGEHRRHSSVFHIALYKLFISTALVSASVTVCPSEYSWLVSFFFPVSEFVIILCKYCRTTSLVSLVIISITGSSQSLVFLSLHFHKIILCEMQRTKRGMFSWYEILSWVQS